MASNGESGIRTPPGEGRPLSSCSLALFLVILGTDLSKSRKILGFYLRRGFVLAANRVVDFLAVDADLLWSVDPQANFVSADVHYGHLDVVTDHDRFVALTGQHQHVQAPSC